MNPPVDPARFPPNGRGARLPRLLWLALPAVLLGFGALESHSLGVGAPPRPPAQVADARATGRLLVFLHPRCPCSRATVVELDRIAQRAGERVSIRAFVLADPAIGEAGPGASTWDRVAAIPGAAVEADPGGARAREFGVETSGTVLLYGAGGELLFDGGITAARGHEGANGSTAALLERIELGRGGRVSTPVFGCALGASAEQGPG